MTGHETLLERAAGQPELGDLLTSVGFVPMGPPGICAAHGNHSSVAVGAGWLAVGDAALACDPLSSQGLLNALYFARMAAEALRAALAGDHSATANYQQIIDRVAAAYRSNLLAWYDLEARWPDRPFWSRRRQALCAGAR